MYQIDRSLNHRSVSTQNDHTIQLIRKLCHICKMTDITG